MRRMSTLTRSSELSVLYWMIWHLSVLVKGRVEKAASDGFLQRQWQRRKTDADSNEDGNSRKMNQIAVSTWQYVGRQTNLLINLEISIAANV